MTTTVPTFRAIARSGACGILLLVALATPSFAQPPISDPQSDAELRKRLEPLIPSFRAALAGDSADAQHATLSVFADIPASVAGDTGLSVALVKFLQRDIKDPEIVALALRSFGKSKPAAADLETVVGRFVNSEHTVVRRAAAECLASSVFNSDPKRVADRTSTYFIDVSRRAAPLLGKAVEDKDTVTQKHALGGIQSAANILNGLYTIDTEPTEIGAKPVDRQTKFGPVIRALAAVVPKLGAALASPDASTRVAAARTFESLSALRKAILTSRGPGDPEIADPFAGGWPFVRDGIAKGLKDPDEHVRLAMTEAVEALGDAAEVRRLLREGTNDPVVFVRWAAARALGESAPVKAPAAEVAPDVAALTRLLDDPDLDVRAAAITALGKFGPGAKSGAPKLLAAVGKGDIEPRVAAVTALGLIESDAESTVPVLIAGLQNEDLRLRRASATGLARFGPAAKAALPELRKALVDPDPELRLATAEAILAIEQKGKFKEL
jgi:HEAT repeat protein